MKLNPIGSNMTEVEIGDKTVLFSYKTPVAYYDGTWLYITTKKWSKTTTSHINKWLESRKKCLGTNLIPLDISQEKLDSLV